MACKKTWSIWYEASPTQDYPKGAFVGFLACSDTVLDDDGRTRRLEESKAASPLQRPSPRSWWILIACIVLRLRLLVWLQPRSQCTQLSVEVRGPFLFSNCLALIIVKAALPLLLAIYDKFLRSRPALPNEDRDDEDDIENDVFQDCMACFNRSLTVNIVAALILSAGFCVVSLPSSNSTLICPASESRYMIIALQCLGVVLDAAILVLLWRRLHWPRTTRDRFAELTVILGAATCCVGSIALFGYRQALGAEMFGIGPLYYYHIFFQSLVFLIISSIFFILQFSPLTFAATVTLLCGAYASRKKLSQIGTFEQLSKLQLVLGSCAVGTGFIILAFRNNIKHVILPRGLLLFLLCCWAIGSSIYSVVETGQLDRHPLDKIIYSARTEGNRWLVQNAKVSESLSVATKEYKDRHNGRSPPKNFDIWYDFATTRNSEIIDHFPQIDDDLRPFWNIKPSRIQEEITKLGVSRGMAIVSIKNGVVAAQPPAEPYDVAIVGDLVELIQPFAQFLPDMDLPVNLLDRPRVLAPSSGLARTSQDNSQTDDFMWSWEHQRQLAQACPSNAESSVAFYSHTREFCSSCAFPQSIQQFLADTNKGRDLCHQPDMFNLHSFYISLQTLRPFGNLVPVFSRTKTNQHKDILIPLSRGSDDFAAEAKDKTFHEKADQLFWRGEVAAEPLVTPWLVSGGHQERLSHLINNASDWDAVTMLLMTDQGKFRYEKTPLDEANRVLKFDAGISDYSACTTPACDAAKKEFGVKPKDQDDNIKMDSRFVMVMDGDDGPPKDFLKVLRSNSVPLVASIFKVKSPDAFLSALWALTCHFHRSGTQNASVPGYTMFRSICASMAFTAPWPTSWA